MGSEAKNRGSGPPRNGCPPRNQILATPLLQDIQYIHWTIFEEVVGAHVLFLSFFASLGLVAIVVQFLLSRRGEGSLYPPQLGVCAADSATCLVGLVLMLWDSTIRLEKAELPCFDAASFELTSALNSLGYASLTLGVPSSFSSAGTATSPYTIQSLTSRYMLSPAIYSPFSQSLPRFFTRCGAHCS